MTAQAPDTTPTSPARQDAGRSLLVFRPQACPDPALLERILFARERLADLLADRVRDSVLTGSLHQQLIYGPRGSGKTHVLTVVLNRLTADAELAGKLLIARLAEEQWDIASFSDLCVRILAALAERYPDSPAAGWEERLRAIPVPARSADLEVTGLERAALGLIQETVGPNLLLVIAENLADLFPAIGEEGQRKLRAHLQQSRNWALLASSQSLFPALTSRAEPFFRFFQTHELAALDAAATHGFLQRLADDPAIGDPTLRRTLGTPQGEQRIHAIDKLCGGNHRLLTMLYPFLTGEGLVDLVEPFLRMVDRELTPYYQERLRWLSSAQQRKIAAYLAREGRPRTMKEVARACFITEQGASKQLRELERVGFVLLTREGRQTFCEIREPLLRLVLDLQDHRDGAARTIVRVLRAWYSPPQLADLETSEAIRGSRLYHESVRTALMETRAEMHTQLAAALDGMDEIVTLSERGHFGEALELIQARAQAGPQGPVLMALEAAALGGLGRWAEAEKRFEKAQRAALASEDQVERACALVYCGTAASLLGWDERAVELVRQGLDDFRQLAKVAPDPFESALALSLGNVAKILFDLGRHEDALDPAEEATDKYRRLAEQRPGAFLPDLARILNTHGSTLAELGRHEDALAAAQEAVATYRGLVERRPGAFLHDLATGLNNLGNRLAESGRHEEALETAREATEICRQLAEQRPETFLPILATSLSNLGTTLSDLDRHEEALAPAQEAVGILCPLAEQRPGAFLPDLAISQSNLANTLTGLGRHEEAIERRLEAVQSLLPPYRDSEARIERDLRRYTLRWLHHLWQCKGHNGAWQAMTDLAQDMPPEDPLAIDLILTTAIWAQEWAAVRERIHGVASSGRDPGPAVWETASAAFVEAAVRSGASADDLRSAYADSSDSFRNAVSERLLGMVPELLKGSLEQVAVAEGAAQRMEAVFGRDDLPGKALELLRAGLEYLKSGKQVKALLHLPVEQRRLIEEACE